MLTLIRLIGGISPKLRGSPHLNTSNREGIERKALVGRYLNDGLRRLGPKQAALGSDKRVDGHSSRVDGAALACQPGKVFRE